MKLAPLDSAEESTLPAGWPGKLLILSQNSGSACRGGFQLDSPVRNPAASEIARSSPPVYDQGPGGTMGGGTGASWPLTAHARLYWQLKWISVALPLVVHAFVMRA